MLITNKQELKNKTIQVENKLIGHNKTIKILGTTFNDQLNWERPPHHREQMSINPAQTKKAHNI